jgi:S-adenosylmethionine synthetase
VDTGATNRKLGSDMADSVTGGGLHGKDLSKADVSVNIWAWLKAQETGKPVEVCCAIGDDHVGGVPFSEMVETARDYIMNLGGFERFAEWCEYSFLLYRGRGERLQYSFSVQPDHLRRLA